MKQTPEDQEYAQRFGERLESAYTLAKSNGVTDEAFAASIGVKRSALKKYLLGKSTPSLRSIVLAKRNHQISVPYGETGLGRILQRDRDRPRHTALQLRLPFSLQMSQGDKYQVELKELKPLKYELRISAKREEAQKASKKQA